MAIPDVIGVRAGSLVFYRAHEDWGQGLVRKIERSGLLRVDFEVDGNVFSDVFHPNELRVPGPKEKKR